ncbi:CCA tRNA nucleotidyltransferase [Ellagibacter isourolithinifaciens]|uniref:CCA tRNA nucleotidyltransferase n=1 Tax=Ellagibacter isourolithinifaciens TaxID=2137581 RepID=UPI003A91A7D9
MPQVPENAFSHLPDAAIHVVGILEAGGFEAWFVGGFVRDALLGRPCSDIDIASNASWQQAQALFEAAGFKTHETGVAHGTLTVLVDNEAFEVTTYRRDGAYSDSRHPSSVEFVSSIEEDLARRDFTMNAIAFHPLRGLLDPYGGVGDLQAKTIRAVGDPAKRFSEDALRILRACRFAAQLGFDIEDETLFGMLSNKGIVYRVSAERVAHELDRLLTAPFAGSALVKYVDVLSCVLPELVSMKGFEQHTPYHIYDVLEHTAHVVDGVPADRLVRWAALFHDMGKPACFFFGKNGVGHFYGHANVSVMLARGIMSRLKMSPTFANRVLTLVKHHDEVVEPTPRAVKRMLARLDGDVELFCALCDLKRGDARGQAPHCAGRIDAAYELEKVLADIQKANEAFTLQSLAIDGRDVMVLGIPRGPEVGKALSRALDAVIDEKVPNEKGALLNYLSK